MLTPTQMRWSLRGAATVVLAAMLALAAVPKADAARSWGAASRVVTPVPASPTPLGMVGRVHWHAQGFDRVVASVHYQRDAIGNGTLRAAGAVASYDRLGRPTARPLALRVVLVGDPHGLRRARALETTRRARRGPARIAGSGQARVLAFVYRDGEWKQYLVVSRRVTIS